jgi:EpsI family protein
VPAIGPRGLPTDLAAWQGPLAPHDDWQPEFPGDVTVLRAAYDNATRGGVTVALVFYRRETQGAELAGFGHVLADPRQWHLATSQVIDVDGVGSLNETRFTELSARRSLRVWSAYAVDGRPVTNPAIAKLLGLVWRARQPSEAVSFFAIAHEEDADVAGTDEVLRDFVHTALIPLLHCARHEAREEVCANAHSH